MDKDGFIETKHIYDIFLDGTVALCASNCYLLLLCMDINKLIYKLVHLIGDENRSKEIKREKSLSGR